MLSDTLNKAADFAVYSISSVVMWGFCDKTTPCTARNPDVKSLLR